MDAGRGDAAQDRREGHRGPKEDDSRLGLRGVEIRNWGRKEGLSLWGGAPLEIRATGAAHMDRGWENGSILVQDAMTIHRGSLSMATHVPVARRESVRGVGARRLSCTHILHTRCMLDIMERSHAPPPLCCPVSACGSRRERVLVLDCVVHEDSDTTETIWALVGETQEQAPERRTGQHFGWSQNSLGMARPLD